MDLYRFHIVKEYFLAIGCPCGFRIQFVKSYNWDNHFRQFSPLVGNAVPGVPYSDIT